MTLTDLELSYNLENLMLDQNSSDFIDLLEDIDDMVGEILLEILKNILPVADILIDTLYFI